MNIVKLQDIKLICRNPLAFLYTNTEKSEREIKETISFTITMEIIKYLQTKDFYKKNMKHWWKKSKMTQMEKYTVFMDWKNKYSEN